MVIFFSISNPPPTKTIQCTVSPLQHRIRPAESIATLALNFLHYSLYPPHQAEVHAMGKQRVRGKNTYRPLVHAWRRGA